ncbi:DNA replication and repair protein RecO [Bryocella elongata]|uniref:DNA repair protein RecO n=1 Tax=Bryocella elongata TaxID=863522 RepID=A0A1H5ZA25_9BACT|nr:DNA repair protein RecO [Bryocella elongata]SEG32575.1 DNA replication and repair protein RecO [Bryocella elongata]
MAEGRQIPHHGEAIVLRSWPFLEADLLVSLFTREQGKVKGVARHAMRSRRRFGGALEPATYVQAHYTERPKQDLVRLDQFEILWSPMTAPVDWLRAAGMQFVVEVLDEAMPDLAAEDNVFRLAMTCLTAMEGGARGQGPGFRAQSAEEPRGSTVWIAAMYFALWMNRLMGWMPDLAHCAACGLDLREEMQQGRPVWWSPTADGVSCGDDRKPDSRALSAQSVAESYRIARTPLKELLEEEWPAKRAGDLRAFAIAVLERHLERRIRSGAGFS